MGWLVVVVVMVVVLVTAVGAQPTDYSQSGQALQSPVAAVSSQGRLTKTLTLAQFRYQGHADTAQMWTRAYDGGLPGPVLRVKRGDRLTLTVLNGLGSNPLGNAITDTAMHSPNTTNLHFHGLHASPDTPADDVSLALQPGRQRTWVVDIPVDHAPGTHLYYSAFRGSSALQMGGGASGMIIVEDEPGLVGSHILALPEVIVHMQEFAFDGDRALPTLASATGGTMLSSASAASTFVLVNGYYKPVVTMNANQWYRFRVAWASSGTPLEWEITGCVLQVLAKDGVYLQSARVVTSVLMAPANTVDVAVACPDAGTYSLQDSSQATAGKQDDMGMGMDTTPVVVSGELLTLTVVASSNPSITLLSTTEFDAGSGYLSDLTTAQPHYSLAITIASSNTFGCVINGAAFDGGPLATTAPGQIHEWTISGLGTHPFHLHTTPFQIVELSQESELVRVGDWADTLLLPGTSSAVKVRFQTSDFEGEYAFHSQNLAHMDTGCFGLLSVRQEVVDSDTDSDTPTPTPTPAPAGGTSEDSSGGGGANVGAIVGGVMGGLVGAVAIAAVVTRRKRMGGGTGRVAKGQGSVKAPGGGWTMPRLPGLKKKKKLVVQRTKRREPSAVRRQSNEPGGAMAEAMDKRREKGAYSWENPF